MTDVSGQPIGPMFKCRHMKMGPVGCPETSVRSYSYSLRNVPEERGSYLPRGGSVKSRE